MQCQAFVPQKYGQKKSLTNYIPFFSLLNSKSTVFKCLKDSGFHHRLVGTEGTYQEEELDGVHRPCLDAGVAMVKQSIIDLLTSTPQLWICSSCRFQDDHLAMLSSQPTCDCGLSLEDTIGVYSSMWMDGLVRR